VNQRACRGKAAVPQARDSALRNLHTPEATGSIPVVPTHTVCSKIRVLSASNLVAFRVVPLCLACHGRGGRVASSKVWSGCAGQASIPVVPTHTVCSKIRVLFGLGFCCVSGWFLVCLAGHGGGSGWLVRGWRGSRGKGSIPVVPT